MSKIRLKAINYNLDDTDLDEYPVTYDEFYDTGFAPEWYDLGIANTRFDMDWTVHTKQDTKLNWF